MSAFVRSRYLIYSNNKQKRAAMADGTTRLIARDLRSNAFAIDAMSTLRALERIREDEVGKINNNARDGH